MKKKRWVLLSAVLLLAVLFCACGGKPEGEKPVASPELSPAASAMASESPLPTREAVESPAPEESEPAMESPEPTATGWEEPLTMPWGDTPPETTEERRMLAYQAVMERFLTEGLFPDGAPVDFSAEDRSKNQFTIWDVDRDEVEELVVLITTTQTQAGHTALIYEYDGAHGVNVTLQTYPRLTFYSGGTIQTGWPADYSSGGDVIWPYTLFTHDYQTGEYREAGSAKARTKALEGVKFPAEADEDGDGIVYCINMDYEHPIDGAAYEAWRESILSWEREVKVPFYPWTEENIAAIGDLVMNEAQAKVLIEQANAALAPFLGEGAVECGQEGWLLLEGYSTQEELLEGLKGPFTNRLAESFYESYAPLILKEEEGKVYIRSNSQDIIGHYYDMDLETIVDIREDAALLCSDYAFAVEGTGNGTPVKWEIGINKQGVERKISHYFCHGTQYGEYDERTVILNEIPYRTRYSLGSPVWLGEPEKVEEHPEVWGMVSKTEHYPGLEITLYDMQPNLWTGESGFTPWYIWVTKPGIPTSRGVEVGMTMKEVLAAYPQFDMMGADYSDDPVYTRWYPWYRGEYAGDCVLFYFDDNFILEKIFFNYDVSE